MSFFNSLKIRTKLITGFGTMVFLLIVTGLIGFRSFFNINKNLSEIFNNLMPGSMVLLEADRDLHQLLVAERSMIFSDPQSESFNKLWKDYQENLSQFQKRVQKYKAVASLDTEKKLLAEYDEAQKAWYESSSRVIELSKDTSTNAHSSAIALSLGETALKFETMRSKIDNLIDLCYEKGDREHDLANKNYSMGLVLIIIAIIIGALFGIAFSVFISTGIVASLRNAIESFKKISEGSGDLTKRLVVKTKDEVGTLAYWFNKFIELLQKDFRELSESARITMASSQKLEEFASQMQSGSGELTSYVNNVAASSEQISAGVKSSVSTIEQVSSKSSTMATAAEEMSATINEIARNAETARSSSSGAVEQAKQASQKMENLGNNAQEIGKITSTIQDISNQINLLSLNASIEASSAGSAGKGFAVVAKEIKDLSKRTAKATMDIGAQIENMQNITIETASDISGIVKMIEDVNSTIVQIAAAAEEQSAATKEIVQNIIQVSNGMQEVTQQATMSSDAIQTIARDINEINASSGSSHKVSVQLADSAKDLKSAAEYLEKVVGKFTI